MSSIQRGEETLLETSSLPRQRRLKTAWGLRGWKRRNTNQRLGKSKQKTKISDHQSDIWDYDFQVVGSSLEKEEYPRDETYRKIRQPLLEKKIPYSHTETTVSIRKKKSNRAGSLRSQAGPSAQNTARSVDIGPPSGVVLSEESYEPQMTLGVSLRSPPRKESIETLLSFKEDPDLFDDEEILFRRELLEQKKETYIGASSSGGPVMVPQAVASLPPPVVSEVKMTTTKNRGRSLKSQYGKKKMKKSSLKDDDILDLLPEKRPKPSGKGLRVSIPKKDPWRERDIRKAFGPWEPQLMQSFESMQSPQERYKEMMRSHYKRYQKAYMYSLAPWDPRLKSYYRRKSMKYKREPIYYGGNRFIDHYGRWQTLSPIPEIRRTQLMNSLIKGSQSLFYPL